jgi:hypothetical protein
MIRLFTKVCLDSVSKALTHALGLGDVPNTRTYAALLKVSDIITVLRALDNRAGVSLWGFSYVSDLDVHVLQK